MRAAANSAVVKGEASEEETAEVTVAAMVEASVVVVLVAVEPAADGNYNLGNTAVTISTNACSPLSFFPFKITPKTLPLK